MLKDTLYTIQKIAESGNVIEASVKLNVAHAIFKGHFPVHAVLPGACMLQMVKEILELSFNEKLQFVKSREVKFLRMIEPDANTAIIFSIEYSGDKKLLLNINAKIIKEGIVCCKIQASYKSGA